MWPIRAVMVMLCVILAGPSDHTCVSLPGTDPRTGGPSRAGGPPAVGGPRLSVKDLTDQKARVPGSSLRLDAWAGRGSFLPLDSDGDIAPPGSPAWRLCGHPRVGQSVTPSPSHAGETPHPLGFPGEPRRRRIQIQWSIFHHEKGRSTDTHCGWAGPQGRAERRLPTPGAACESCVQKRLVLRSANFTSTTSF